MNNEIKEILEQLEWYRKIGKKDVYYPECVLANKKAFLLLDYITNLQQENERLKEWKKDLLNENIELENIRKEAIEYVKENEFYLDYKTGACIKGVIPLLNILQNGSEK